MAASEAVLLKRFASKGDAEAFAEIVEQHAPLVYGVCLRILEDKDRAADAVQDTFLQLVRNAASISGSLTTWLHRVATRRAIDLVRADSQRRQRESQYATEPEIMQSGMETATWRGISTCIDEELDQLDDQMREVLALRFFQGRTTSEIANKCGISRQTVSRRLESGVNSLRHRLKSRGIAIPATVLVAMLGENIVKAAPAFVMKELGKIALAGGQATVAATSANIGTRILASLAVKAKIIATAAVITLLAGSAAIFYNSTQQTEAAGDLPQTETADSITARELVEQYVQAVNSWDKSVAMRVETVIAQTRREYDPDMLLYWTYDFQYRRDGDKCEWFGSVVHSDNVSIPSSWETQFRIIVGDDFYLNYSKRDFDEESEAFMGSDVNDALYGLEFQDSYGNFLEGWVNRGVDATCKIAELMKECKDDDLKLIGQETISDASCFIVEAKTLYGTYTAWIAPEKGYNALKYTLSKSGRDILRDDITIDDQGITLWEEVVDSIDVEKIDGVFIPVSGQIFSTSDDNQGGGTTTQMQVKRSEIVLNPDFEFLDAFKIVLPEGTVVTHKDIPGIQFTWTNGKFVPDMDEYLPRNLAGKTLSGFGEIMKGFDTVTTTGKMVLVCFWDMNQRPSRNCIMQLNTRAQELKTQDIEIIAVQASTIKQDTLDEWVKENNISLPVGMIEADEEETRLDWGIKSLPWLILTDTEHIVTSEGFSLSELEKVGITEN